MNSNKPAIWINVSTSAHWQRAVVGVVRVETELASELKKLYPAGQFKQCIWQEGQFIEWQETDKNSVTVPAEKNNKNPVYQPNNSELPYPVLTRPLAYQAILQGTLSLTPESLRPFLNQFLVTSRRKIRSWRQRLLLRSERHAEGVVAIKDTGFAVQSQTKPRTSMFKAGDILLSVGLDWDYPYTQEFARLRTEEGIKVASCCYDLIPVLFPQYCVGDVAAHFAAYFLQLANSSDIIFCISKQSESDLKSLLYQTGGADVETHIMPLGDNVPEGDATELSEEIKKIITEPFMLFVSTLERRKNHQVLYQAYHLLCQQGKKEQLPKLVFVGMQGWGVSELIQDIELDPLTKGLIVHCNNVSDTELRSLYDAALCCVYPSLYEGWGLPVAEALALGKIVLSSDRGSLPEVGGNLVTYIDPWNPKEWADKIWQVVADQDYRSALTAKVLAGYQQRTWEDTAQVVKSQLDELLNQTFQQQMLCPGYDLTTQIGQAVGPVIRSNGNTGILLAGPHRALPSGRFTISIWDELIKRKAGSCTFTLLADQQEIYRQQEMNFTREGLAEVPLIEFDIELEQGTQDFDLRCQLISGELSIERVEIKAC